MRILLASITLGALTVPAMGHAQANLDGAAPGTIVEGSFVLKGKVVPLPPGRFKLASIQERSSKASAVGVGNQVRSTTPIAEVVLVQAEGGKLRAAVWAKANAESGSRWVNEPCKRTDTLFRLDRAKSFNYLQDCVMVNHFVGFLSKPGGILAGAYDTLKADGVEVPVKTVIEAALTRIDQREYLEVLYRVNPEAFGFSAEAATSWLASEWHPARIDKDPRKAAFVKAFTDWALGLEQAMERGFRGKEIPAGSLPGMQLPPGS